MDSVVSPFLKKKTMNIYYKTLFAILFALISFDALNAMENPYDNFESRTNFRWIDDLIAGMAMPHAGDIEELAQRNVGLIVTLCAPEECDELSPAAIVEQLILAAGLEIATLYLPIRALGIPTFEQVDRFIEETAKAQARGKATVVHCEYGYGRTGVMLACELITKGYSPSIAINMVRSHDSKTFFFSGKKRSIECLEQIIFIEKYYQYFYRHSNTENESGEGSAQTTLCTQFESVTERTLQYNSDEEASPSSEPSRLDSFQLEAVSIATLKG